MVFQNENAPEKKDNSDCGDKNTDSVSGKETVNGDAEKSETKLSKRERKEERKRLAKKGEKKDKEETKDTQEGKTGKKQKKKRKHEEDTNGDTNENEHKSKNKSKKSKMNGTEVEPLNKKQRTEDVMGELLIYWLLPLLPERSTRVMHLGLFLCLHVCLDVRNSTKYRSDWLVFLHKKYYTRRWVRVSMLLGTWSNYNHNPNIALTPKLTVTLI